MRAFLRRWLGIVQIEDDINTIEVCVSSLFDKVKIKPRNDPKPAKKVSKKK